VHVARIRREVQTGFGGEIWKKDHLEDKGVDWGDNIKVDLQEYDKRLGLDWSSSR